MTDELSRQVAAVEQRSDRLESLCGEMLATLLLPANQKFIHVLLKRHAKRWDTRYKKITQGEYERQTTDPPVDVQAEDDGHPTG